jgi:hypothetical protein
MKFQLAKEKSDTPYEQQRRSLCETVDIACEKIVKNVKK